MATAITSRLSWIRRRQPSERVDGTLGVLFVHTATMPPLGADTWVQSQIIANLDRATHRVHVACAFGPSGSPTPTYAAMARIHDVHLVDVDFGRERSALPDAGRVRAARVATPSLRSLAALVRLVRREDIAVIHTTDRPRDAGACVLIAAATRRPCVIHAHVGFDASWMSRTLQWAYRRADGIIAISDFVASTLIDSGHDAERVHVVLNGIDIEPWTPDAAGTDIRAEFGLSDDDLVVLTVCRLFAGKGTTELIRAFAVVHAELGSTRLLVVGREMQAGYLGELQRLVVELGLEGRVDFTGQRSDVRALMAAADIFAMPSMYEPFGLVYLEAMAMCLPVVALANGGTPEVVRDGIDGLLCAPDDIDRLAANLMTYARDPTLRDITGARSRQRVATQFSTVRMARGVAAVYQLLASDNSRSRRIEG